MAESTPRFRQLMLSQAQLDAGLVSHPNLPEPPPDAEPLPWETLAVIRAEPDTLAERWNLTYQKTVDGLDTLYLAVLDLRDGLRISLWQYRDREFDGTYLNFAPENLMDLAHVRQNPYAAGDAVQEEALVRILDALGLTSDDLSWIRPLPHPWSADWKPRDSEHA